MIDSDRALWRACIAQAFTDLMIPEPETSNKGSRSRVRVRKRAVKWLTTPSLDLSIVCACAELEPAKVIEAAKGILSGKVIFHAPE